MVLYTLDLHPPDLHPTGLHHLDLLLWHNHLQHTHLLDLHLMDLYPLDLHQQDRYRTGLLHLALHPMDRHHLELSLQDNHQVLDKLLLPEASKDHLSGSRQALALVNKSADRQALLPLQQLHNLAFHHPQVQVDMQVSHHLQLHV